MIGEDFGERRIMFGERVFEDEYLTSGEGARRITSGDKCEGELIETVCSDIEFGSECCFCANRGRVVAG